ncbi:inner membrane protein [Trabulsiella guamensis ATCC 49490]|uniref:Flagellar brake protein YcgR n=1 Tax=Trabulsiella guamensis ATCC 49490 TaxID=1005994 RepID=A0A085APV3_9ENTR|nr:flagellar brake protein [Trabulsiella guamensis]KFC12248.1 inner membrane protein [Trabulsiella guamensis ATCC 49490]
MSHYNEQFLKVSPLAVLNVLRDLHKDQVPLRVSWASGQFISRILSVTAEALIIDFGSQEQENLAAQQAENFLIDAETKGAKVEFTLPRLVTVDYLSLPAFTAPVPPSLWFVQRREFFRIAAPLHPVYLCTARLPDNSELRCRLCDLSLGGMGALLESKTTAGLQVGMQIPQLQLDMGDWGTFQFDAQLIAITAHKVVDGKNETISTPRLSFRFLNVNPAAERTLQRIIFGLEREARERASKVR